MIRTDSSLQKKSHKPYLQKDKTYLVPDCPPHHLKARQADVQDLNREESIYRYIVHLPFIRSVQMENKVVGSNNGPIFHPMPLFVTTIVQLPMFFQMLGRINPLNVPPYLTSAAELTNGFSVLANSRNSNLGMPSKKMIILCLKVRQHRLKHQITRFPIDQMRMSVPIRDGYETDAMRQMRQKQAGPFRVQAY